MEQWLSPKRLLIAVVLCFTVLTVVAVATENPWPVALGVTGWFTPRLLRRPSS